MALQCEPDAILLPKVEAPETMTALAASSGQPVRSARLWAMVESPKALVAINAIADASPRLPCLVIGPNDLSKSTGVPMRPGRMAMMPWFMAIIAAARANGLAVLDGVYNNFRDIDGFAAECAQGAELGFDGKTLIHPSQIEAANAAFSPVGRNSTAPSASSRPFRTRPMRIAARYRSTARWSNGCTWNRPATA